MVCMRTTCTRISIIHVRRNRDTRNNERAIEQQSEKIVGPKAMPRTQVKVPWKEGLHLRQAAGVVRLAQGFRSTIFIRFGSKLADARSILSIVMLCASMGAVLEVEASGDDAFDAVRAVEMEFSIRDGTK